MAVIMRILNSLHWSKYRITESIFHLNALSTIRQNFSTVAKGRHQDKIELERKERRKKKRKKRKEKRMKRM